jgi:hypothetical protein
MIGAAGVACTLALAPGVDTPDSAAVVLERASYRVRSTDARALAWIQAGAVGSATFRDLLKRLSESDLIVYVQVVDGLNGAFGHTYFVKATDTVRYIRIEVVPSGNFHEMVALVGHELQHAVEIAGAPRVRDRQTLAQFYLGMGENALSSGQYDSVEARATEERVKRELVGSSAYRSSVSDRSPTRFKQN